jgi:hypothetical protein
MRKTAINSVNNYGGGSLTGPSERSSYHNPTSLSSSDKKCDSCRYKVSMNECTTFKCKDCGTYIVSLIL